jgi:hypothetical protein
MKHARITFAAAALVLAACQAAVAQTYVPAPPIARPNVLPKPVANRLIKRPAKTAEAETPAARN